VWELISFIFALSTSYNALMPRRVKISFLIFLQFVAINILMAQSASSYAELISSGDAYLAKKEYYNAKTSYQLASQLDEIAEYPKNKIEEIIKILDAELELRIVYEDKMLLAEEAYVEKDYELAISLYKAASKIIDYEYKPKTEILRIEKERETLKNYRIAFEQLILDAGKAKVAEDYLLAISKLKEANELFPEQSNLIIEIAQLNLKLKQKDARNVKFKELIAIADRRR